MFDDNNNNNNISMFEYYGLYSKINMRYLTYKNVYLSQNKIINFNLNPINNDRFLYSKMYIFLNVIKKNLININI